MKKLLIAILILSGYAHAETSTATADSGDWYHKESFALDMAQTRAKNGASKLCSQRGGSVMYKTWEFGAKTCESKPSGNKTKWRCKATASTQCATKNEVKFKCSGGKQKLFKLEAVLGPKKNVIKMIDTQNGMFYTINTRYSNAADIEYFLCSESQGDDRSAARKAVGKLKSYTQKWCKSNPDKCKTTKKDERTGSSGKRG